MSSTCQTIYYDASLYRVYCHGFTMYHAMLQLLDIRYSWYTRSTLKKAFVIHESIKCRGPPSLPPTHPPSLPPSHPPSFQTTVPPTDSAVHGTATASSTYLLGDLFTLPVMKIIDPRVRPRGRGAEYGIFYKHTGLLTDEHPGTRYQQFVWQHFVNVKLENCVVTRSC